MYITEEDLEYYVNPVPTYTVNEATVLYGHQMSFEEAVKACNGITLEEFSKMWDELIENDLRLI